MEDFQMVSVRLSKDLDDRLKRLADRTDRSKTYYVEKALHKFLQEEEEIEWATAAYREFLESGGKTISHEEFLAKNPHLHQK